MLLTEKVHHNRLNNKSMAVVFTKCVIGNDKYKKTSSVLNSSRTGQPCVLSPSETRIITRKALKIPSIGSQKLNLFVKVDFKKVYNI